MRMLLFCLLAVGLVSPGLSWERESYYSDQVCQDVYKGKPTTLPSGLKPDCVTEFAVIEFDWAKSPKHYECIGQALVYSHQTGKTPVCVLMAKSDSEFRFAQGLNALMLNSGVVLRVIKLSE